MQLNRPQLADQCAPRDRLRIRVTVPSANGLPSNGTCNLPPIVLRNGRNIFGEEECHGSLAVCRIRSQRRRCLSFCFFYFISLLRSSRSADLRRLETLARRALYRAAALFGLTLLIVGFNPELIPKLTRIFSGRAQVGLARRGEIKVWVDTKSRFYYCSGTKAYGKLEPGT